MDIARCSTPVCGGQTSLLVVRIRLTRLAAVRKLPLRDIDPVEEAEVGSLKSLNPEAYSAANTSLELVPDGGYRLRYQDIESHFGN